jgi:mannose/fructose/N-acetylgalactosamine-specific phosphotransferase system component IID
MGFAAAVSPALNKIYRDRPEELASARQRVIQFFNTNPMLSGLVIGAALKLEEQRAQGLIAGSRGSLIVSALASSLAGIGDQLFWKTWLPFCSLLGFGLTWISLSQGRLTWAPLAVPAVFCLLSVPIRLGGLFYGYRTGQKAHQAVKKFHVPDIIRWVQRVTIFLTGFLTVFSLKLIPGKPSLSEMPYFLALTGAVFSAAVIQRYRPRIGPAALYLLIILVLALITLIA